MVVILLFPLSTNTLNECDEIHENGKCSNFVKSDYVCKPSTTLPSTSSSRQYFRNANAKPKSLFSEIKSQGQRPRIFSNRVPYRNNTINPRQSNTLNKIVDIHRRSVLEESEFGAKINDQCKLLDNIKENDVFSRQQQIYNSSYIQQPEFDVKNVVNGRNEARRRSKYDKHPENPSIKRKESKASKTSQTFEQSFINNKGLEKETPDDTVFFNLNNNKITQNKLKKNCNIFHALAPAYRTIEEGNNFTNSNCNNNIFYDGFSNSSNTTFRSNSYEYDTHYITRVNFYELNNSQVDIDSKHESDVPIVVAGIHREEELPIKKITELPTKKQNEIKVDRHIVFEDAKIIDDSNSKKNHNTIEEAQKENIEINVDKHLDTLDEKPKQEIGLLKKTEEPVTVRINSRKDDEKLDSVPSFYKRNFAKLTYCEHEDNLWEIPSATDLAEKEIKGYKNVSNCQTGHVKKYFMKTKIPHNVSANDSNLVNVNQKQYRVVDKDRDKSSASSYGNILTRKVAAFEDDVDIETCLENEDIWIETNGIVNGTKSENRAKNTEGNFIHLAVNGTPSNSAMRYIASPINFEKNGSFEAIGDPENLSDKLKAQKKLHQRTLLQLQKDRKDALTKRPLNFDIEEETRKGETMKWLESHFGSDSNTSVESNFEILDNKPIKTYFNITIKSSPTEVPKVIQTPVTRRKSSVSFGNYVSCDDIYQQKHNVWKNELTATHVKSNIYQNRLPAEQLKTLPLTKDKAIVEKYQSANDLVEIAYNLQERPKVPERKKHMQKNNTRQGVQKADKTDYVPLLEGYKICNAEHYNSLNRSQFNRSLLTDTPLQQAILDPKNEKSQNQKSAEVETPFDFKCPSKVSKSQPKISKVSNVIGRSLRRIVEKIRTAGSDRKARKSRSQSRDKTVSNTEAEAFSQTYQQYNVIDGHIIGDSSVGRNCNDLPEILGINSSSKAKPRVPNDMVQSVRKQKKSAVPHKQYYLGQNPYPFEREDNIYREYYNEPQVNKEFFHSKGLIGYNSLEKNMRNFRITESMPHLSKIENLTTHTLSRKADENNKLVSDSFYERKQSVKKTPNFLSRNITDIYLDEKPSITTAINHYPIPLNRSKSLTLNAFVEEEEMALPCNQYNKLHSYKKSTIPENHIVESLKSPSIVNLINRSQLELNRFEPIYAKPNSSKKL